jgi:hypothetical protein
LEPPVLEPNNEMQEFIQDITQSQNVKIKKIGVSIYDNQEE